MKNCDEMVNSLLERRDQYAAEQKRKRKVITRTATSMGCVCLVALLVFGMWQGGMFKTPPSVTLDNSINIGEKDYINPYELNNDTNIEHAQGNQGGQQTEHNGNLLVVNKVNSIMSADMDVQFSHYNYLSATELERVHKNFETAMGMSYEAFTAKIPDTFVSKSFYSVDVPADAMRTEYIPHDYVFVYQTENNGEVAIAICADDEPLRDCFIMCDNPEQSEINGVAVVINGYENSFMVQFSYENVNYDIGTSNIMLEELEDLLAGIIC